MNKKKKIGIIISSLIICILMFIGAVKGNEIFTASKVAKSENTQDINKEKIAISNTDKASEEKATIKEDKNDNEKVNKENEANQNNSNERSQSNEEKIAKTDNGENLASSDINSKEKKQVTSDNTNTTDSNSSYNTTATIEKKQHQNETSNPWDNLPEGTILFYDTVNNKTISKAKGDYNGVNIAKLTKTLLNKSGISYECTGISDATTYFAMIAGLREKEAGSLSGWCYYIKRKGSNSFIKPNVSAGQSTFNKGDIVVWKYLSDGVNN
ncbi:hypothetical protein SAMN02745163_01880 [Clostridium cavendishii DSM 21758]|uniref:DUF4430 domain-containing protein n=1 Tax=Clostridium cavendishii DSM 21758 TaxID=1121302 RepID=A0A1M6J128_9CLOT|nr:hypothetical protein [Clostridium cavendishii]SHJ40367.1 hypothetical protein SAMN02745163_01880 [Clostridium cavendishii DSM 21758]